ncbi:ash family protein [Yersinia ruckeri]|uniref:ash family protein n=1 Tax=Yersinia ruckeri TaxID=29486 RepID=UPI003517D5CC|nr:ash family protein [Yersinia ruckeri]
MVGWTGQPKGWPDSLMAGKANSVQLTTSQISLCGGDNKTINEDADHGYYPYPNSAAHLALLLLPKTPFLHCFCLF